jgi:hypothetical protein
LEMWGVSPEQRRGEMGIWEESSVKAVSAHWTVAIMPLCY